MLSVVLEQQQSPIESRPTDEAEVREGTSTSERGEPDVERRDSEQETEAKETTEAHQGQEESNQSTKEPLLAKVFHKHGTNRKWLTYSEKSKSLYCSVCLAYAPPTSESPFIKHGFKTWKHVHQRIEEHEKSKLHRDSADSYFMFAKKADIKSLLVGKQMSLHHEEVKKKHQVMDRIIDVIKVLGKCGLSYRGHRAEAAYMLENIDVNHGNFLELLLLLSRYDLCLQQHINSCTEQSKKHHDSGVKGRGSLVTLMSNHTVGKVVDSLSKLIKATIADEVREAGMFSVQIHTTQDVTSNDQCAVILRYVTDTIHERLVGVINCEKSTGKYLLELLKETIQAQPGHQQMCGQLH
ncbi:zinc finger MYM-type protein 1-like isoform X2 [Thalassophryne amazonica]|uniref:zinc finger MYM-type protein 1-like isoform X2 n=1 Tax=Thalassophryne amazonica TaxID=390379 RepID=UPI00147109FC|nr:zinc finger MYM-type protein 1-like isoform X2 [Thalassophryne amazonica]